MFDTHTNTSSASSVRIGHFTKQNKYEQPTRGGALVFPSYKHPHPLPHLHPHTHTPCDKCCEHKDCGLKATDKSRTRRRLVSVRANRRQDAKCRVAKEWGAHDDFPARGFNGDLLVYFQLPQSGTTWRNGFALRWSPPFPHLPHELRIEACTACVVSL